MDESALESESGGNEAISEPEEADSVETEFDGNEQEPEGEPIAQSTARSEPVVQAMTNGPGERSYQLPTWRSTPTAQSLDDGYARGSICESLGQADSMRDKSRKTIVHDFILPQGETICPLGDITSLMKKENWPLEEFVEKQDMTRRASWVIWAKKFQTVCSLMGRVEPGQAKQMLLLKGGPTIWTVLGGTMHSLEMQELWKRIDEHYATLGDPDAELVKYHEIKQKEGEDFGDFINRLKTQASQAEMTERKEQEELQTAILERSLVGDKLAHERKTKNLSNNDLVLLGASLCKQREKKYMLKRVQSISEHHAHGQQRDVQEVGRIGQFKRKNDGEDSQTRKRPRQARSNTGCRSCGGDHAGRCTAPPTAKLCFKCGKPGHYAVNCGDRDGGSLRQKSVFQVNSNATDNGWVD